MVFEITVNGSWTRRPNVLPIRWRSLALQNPTDPSEGLYITNSNRSILSTTTGTSNSSHPNYFADPLPKKVHDDFTNKQAHISCCTCFLHARRTPRDASAASGTISCTQSQRRFIGPQAQNIRRASDISSPVVPPISDQVTLLTA